MNADWLIGVERWRKTLPTAPRVLVNVLMGLVAIGISAALFSVLFLGFTSGNPAIGVIWFFAALLILYAIVEYHDRKRRR